MNFPPFEHGAWLARAWRHGAPKHNLGASGFQNPLVRELLAGVQPDDVALLDLNAGPELAAAIAKRHGLSPDHVLVTHGTSGANTTVLATLIEPGCNVVAERPTYTPLAALAEGFGAEVRCVERGDAWDVDAVAAACDARTVAILCTSPNNPTGRPLAASDLQRLGDIAQQHGALVLVDQVYRELTDHALGAALHPAIVSTAGMNKCWGAAGLRIGWLVAAPEWVAKFRATASLLHLAPATFGMRMALHLLDHEAACRGVLETHLEGAHAIYRKHGPAWPEPMGLTAFIPVAESQAPAERLLDAGILTVPGELFGAPGHVRIGFGVPHDDLDRALAAFVSNLEAQTF